jgi:hypothetical protein
VTKLSIVRGGGLAGVAVGTVLSSSALPREDAGLLDEKIARSGLLGMTAESGGGAARHADEMQYELTVEGPHGSHSVRAREGALPDEVRSLIEWAETRPEREQRIVSAGG